jgi:outer membrane protein
MRKILLLAAMASSTVAVPTIAQAQRAPAAVIVVVDTDRIANECTACRAAAQQLNGQQSTLRSRAQTLQQQLQTARQPIEQAVNALGGKQPDAALQKRITDYQQQEQRAQTELTNSQRNLQSTQLHVNQQISQRLGPIINQVAAGRGANLALDKNSTLFAGPAVDVTNDVLAQLNRQLPSVSVTPLPQQKQQQQPQGR